MKVAFPSKTLQRHTYRHNIWTFSIYLPSQASNLEYLVSLPVSYFGHNHPFLSAQDPGSLFCQLTHLTG
jgi:hypothetical protein